MRRQFRSMRWAIGTALGWCAMMSAGCGSNQPQSLSENTFMPTAPTPSPVDRPADPPPIADSVDNDSPKEASVVPATQFASVSPIQPLESVSVEPTAATPATTQPSDTADLTPVVAPPADSPGYLTLGGVVVEVNGAPIYANTLLSLQAKTLAAKAKELDEDGFREFARQQLGAQLKEQIQSEVIFALAKTQLTDDEKKYAENLAMEYREDLITKAGGSLELAKRRAAAEGEDFDQAVRENYRFTMWEMLKERHIMPRIQISADDMRSFYDANVDQLYSERAQAQFRVIKIDPARIGGDHARQAARQRIELVRQRTLRGDDFATLAAAENQDDFLKSHSGDPGGWMQRDSYRIDKVDQAIWKIQVGDITPVIETDDGFYIAKLEAPRKDECGRLTINPSRMTSAKG